MVDIPTATSIVTTVSIIIGVIFTILEIRHLTRVRRTDVIMKIYDKFGTKEVLEAVNNVGGAQFVSLEEYRKKYGFTDITMVAVLFEEVGVLLQQNLIDIKMVDRLLGPTLNLLWDRMRPVLFAMREGLNEPFFFSHYEYLVKRLDLYRKKTARP